MKIKNAVIFLLIISVLPLILASNYGQGNYGQDTYGNLTGAFCGDGICNNGETCSSCPGDCGQCSTGGGSSGGGGGAIIPSVKYQCSLDSDCKTNQYCSNHTCYTAQCFNDSSCNTQAGETCWNHQCVKLFDMEILDFESPVKVGEFFNFTYFLKAVAQINRDVEVNFWIEKNGSIVSSGEDTMYMAAYDTKTKTKELFLPGKTASGDYEFYITVTYGSYTATAHRTIEITVNKGSATINIIPEFNYIIYAVAGLVCIGVLIVYLIFRFERKKIKKGLMREEKWIKKHKISILVSILLIILGILVYYFKWYELIAGLVSKIILLGEIYIPSYFNSYWYYLLGGIALFIIGLIFYLQRERIKKILTSEENWIKKYKIPILAFFLVIILGILFYYFKLYELIVGFISKIILLNEIYIIPFFISNWAYFLGGIALFIMGTIFYLKKEKIKKILTSEKNLVKKYKIPILISSLVVILGILFYYFRMYELIVSFISEVILFSRMNVLPFLISNWYYILGGIAAIILIIGLIFLIRKIFRKKIKFYTYP